MKTIFDAGMQSKAINNTLKDGAWDVFKKGISKTPKKELDKIGDDKMEVSWKNKVTDAQLAKAKLTNEVNLEIEDETENLTNNYEIVRKNLTEANENIIIDKEAIEYLETALTEIIESANKLKAALNVAKIADIEL